VEVQGPLGPQIVSDRHSVEQALCQSLQQHFTKAHGSPFLHGQLALDVDLYGCGPAARSILEGTIADHCLPILDYLGATQALQYWVHKGQLSLHSFSLVQWDTLHTAVCAYPHTFQMWLSK